MACRLFGAKSSPEPMLIYWRWDPKKCFDLKSRKCVWKSHLWNGDHFVQASTWWHTHRHTDTDTQIYRYINSRERSPLLWISSTAILWSNDIRCRYFRILTLLKWRFFCTNNWHPIGNLQNHSRPTGWPLTWATQPTKRNSQQARKFYDVYFLDVNLANHTKSKFQMFN